MIESPFHFFFPSLSNTSGYGLGMYTVKALAKNLQCSLYYKIDEVEDIPWWIHDRPSCSTQERCWPAVEEQQATQANGDNNNERQRDVKEDYNKADESLRTTNILIVMGKWYTLIWLVSFHLTSDLKRDVSTSMFTARFSERGSKILKFSRIYLRA